MARLGTCSRDWLDVNGETTSKYFDDTKTYPIDTLWNPYNPEVWINLIPLVYWLIDNSVELFSGHEYRHSASARGSGRKNPRHEDPECNRGRRGSDSTQNIILKPETLKKRAFGDENVMSLVPNDIFASRGRVLW